MVAYHFPPLAGSSGIQRTLRFVQHLPALGWEPLVLSTHPRAYERTSEDLLRDVPPATVVRRAFALDTARHLQFRGRYIGSMARPDRWISWRFDGVRQGLSMVRHYRPDVIWSTYPIATAHVIGAELHRRTGIPWVADFRDPMAQDDYPEDPITRQQYHRIEADAAAHARFCVFTTPGAAKAYQQRYPAHAQRMVVLENGYDEESFAIAESGLGRPAAPEGRPLVLLHSGIVYPSERDPTQLFMALGKLQQQGALRPGDLHVRFRASVHDDLLARLARNHGAQEFIELCPPVPYREALTEMMTADALLVMQAANCNAQIPAKVYEYFRARRPIVALTDPAGDTALTLRSAGVQHIAHLDSVDDIAALLLEILPLHRRGALALPRESAVSQASRQARSQVLAELLERASGE